MGFSFWGIFSGLDSPSCSPVLAWLFSKQVQLLNRWLLATIRNRDGHRKERRRIKRDGGCRLDLSIL